MQIILAAYVVTVLVSHGKGCTFVYVTCGDLYPTKLLLEVSGRVPILNWSSESHTRMKVLSDIPTSPVD